MGASEVHPTTTAKTEVDSIRGRKNKPKGHRLLGAVKSAGRRRYIPWGSAVALLITWIGLYLFAFKLYTGMQDLEEQSRDVFKFLIPYLQTVRQATLITAIIMVALTAMMAVVGLCATLHCDHCYRGRLPSCVCGKLGSRIMCALFWILSYLLNLGWMFILSFMVVMTSAYFAFLPVCLPQAGTTDTFCLNFTVLSNMMMGSSDSNSVNLLLCGGAIDKLCKLTKAILPWYWGAYLGCLVVILGLSHFNGSLAANFAHGKHAGRYTKIRDRTSCAIEWTKNWRVKSLTYYDVAPDSNVSLRKRSIRYATSYSNGAMPNGHVQNGMAPRESRRRGSTSCSDVEHESEVDVEWSSKTVDLKSSNSSIVLSLQRNGDVKKVLALPPPQMIATSKRPPAPPYRPRPSSSQSENSVQGPPLPRKTRSPSITSSQLPMPVNRIKEIRV